MKPDLPAGSVTFVFTDIEGSTRLLGELGSEGYAAALARHREVIRRECADRGGVEVDTQGDAFFIAFPVALDAVAAMAAVDRRLEDGPIRVRAGIHAGHALLTGDGYVGEDVHLASRIAGAAHGGQVVMSDATSAALRREAVAAPPRLIDLGMHRLKDFPDPVRLHQLGDRRFPPLRTLFRTDLPVASTPFVGREGELAAVVDLLGDEATRLLTLTGSGGTGKTRLALRAAEEVSGRFDGGTTWVRLATVSDRALVAPLVAQALDVREEPGVDIVVTLAAALAGRRCVIVLDNLEQLLPDVTLDVESLLRAPGLVVLATSRERLGLAVERVYPVPPMGGDDAVALFTARARALDPSFEPTAIVEELCARLDDLPLAIELAAGRSQLFAPEELLRRLLGHLDLLAATRGSDPRQATLRATFEWSYELLAAEERRLLRALSVFQGGCDYEAAEAVAGATPDRLQSLIDKGLMRRRGSPTGPRYAMLGTIQQFASELLAPEEGASLRGTHLRWLADRLERVAGPARTRDPLALETLRIEQPNILHALGWAVATDDAGSAARLLLGAWFFWMLSGFASDGDRWAGRVVDLAEHSSVPSLQLAQAVAVAGEFPRFRGDPRHALAVKRRALAMLDALPADREALAARAAVLADLSDVLCQLKAYDDGWATAAEALEIRRSLGEPAGIAHALGGMGGVARVRGDHAQAVELLREAARLCDELGDPGEAAGSLVELGLVLRAQGDAGEARIVLDDARARAVESGDSFDLACALAGLGLVAADEDQPVEAVPLLSEADRLFREQGVSVDLTRDARAALGHSRRALARSTSRGSV